MNILGAALASAGGARGPELFGVPLEFFLFGLVLLGVALFHKHTLPIAVGGLAVILGYKILATGFAIVPHVQHEWRILANLLGLLLGFALLARHFEDSKIPEKLPALLPAGAVGAFLLLAIVFVLSSFLDNIAAAMIGGTMARAVFRGRIHVGYLAAIVAASNAGGAGSVVGDTTTTMMWIDGVHWTAVLKGGLGAAVALLFFGGIAARQQHGLQPVVKEKRHEPVSIDWVRVLIVALILVGTIATNVLLDFPAVGVWIAILLGALLRKTAWNELPGALKGSCFLLSLVLCASMMPVDRLPTASWKTAFGLGFVSSVFDNIPLTKLALDQGGYDWGILAYAVGFGGSMIWFGSSAGVAITISFPEGRSVGRWLRHGWHIAIGYVLGFFAILLILGWHPQPKQKKGAPKPPAATANS